MNEDTALPDWLSQPMYSPGPTLKDMHHLKHLLKELNFGMHYGAGTEKLAAIHDQIQQYSDLDIALMKAMMGPATPAPIIGHLFLGGPLHGQRIKTNGMWHYQHQVPVKPNAIGIWSKDDELPTVGYSVVNYVQQKIMLPGPKHGEVEYAIVYVAESQAHEMGTGKKDALFGQYMKDYLSDIQTSANTPVKPPLPEPIPAPPVPVSDGLRITIGGKTIEWTPDENQLAGLLSWAAQSLGPGKDTAA